MNKMGWALLVVTGGLVLVGCIVYAYDYVGVAQFLWVIASGTAGGTVAIFVDDEVNRDHKIEELRRQPP